MGHARLGPLMAFSKFQVKIYNDVGRGPFTAAPAVIANNWRPSKRPSKGTR